MAPLVTGISCDDKNPCLLNVDHNNSYGSHNT
uniref:Uncharacterized protein n=1 Tax=Arundo donax TaxID=35708 RepID=A0A0A9BF01_ARUDO